MKKNQAMRIALLAIMIAVTTVLTLLVRVPIPGGYANFSDVAVVFASLAFGPVVGLVAGGVGTALADFMGGYGQWAGITLLAHGMEGFIIGIIARRGGRWSALLGYVAGATFMVAMYLVGQALAMLDIPPEMAASTWPAWRVALPNVPFNLMQAAVGGLVGLPLYYAVSRAYPAIAQLRDPGGWREE